MRSSVDPDPVVRSPLTLDVDVSLESDAGPVDVVVSDVEPLDPSELLVPSDGNPHPAAMTTSVGKTFRMVMTVSPCSDALKTAKVAVPDRWLTLENHPVEGVRMVEVPESAHHWLHAIRRVAGVTCSDVVGLARRTRVRRATLVALLDRPSMNCAGKVPWVIASALGVQNGSFPSFEHFRVTAGVIRRQSDFSMRGLASHMEVSRASLYAFLNQGRGLRCNQVVKFAMALSLDVWPRRRDRSSSIQADIERYYKG